MCVEYLVYSDRDDCIKYIDGPSSDDYDAIAEFGNFLGRNGYRVVRIRAIRMISRS
jgi:hypothetical protein